MRYVNVKIKIESFYITFLHYLYPNKNVINITKKEIKKKFSNLEYKDIDNAN